MGNTNTGKSGKVILKPQSYNISVIEHTSGLTVQLRRTTNLRYLRYFRYLTL